MLSKNCQTVIEQGNGLLPAKKSSSLFDLQEKAATLLLITAKLAHERRVLEGQLLQATSVEKATFANIFSMSMVKTVSERQLRTEADPMVLKCHEDSGNVKSDISYVSTMIDVFNNAHILYRQVMKDENQV